MILNKVVICWGLMKCRPLDLADTHYTIMFFMLFFGFYNSVQ